MKKTTGAAIALAAAITAGGVAMAIPSQAASSSDSASVGQYQGERGDHTHATISATVTGIPSTVTSSRDVALGAYFSAYVLADGATAPATAPSDSHRIHVGKGRGHDSATAISGSTLTSELRLRGGLAGTTTRVALYPSDGSAPAIVTIKVDQNSVVTVTSSKPLTVAYSAAVAAESKANKAYDSDGHGRGHRDGDGDGRGHRGDGRGHSDGDRDGHRGSHGGSRH